MSCTGVVRSLKLGNVFVQLIFGPGWSTNQLYKKPNMPNLRLLTTSSNVHRENTCTRVLPGPSRKSKDWPDEAEVAVHLIFLTNSQIHLLTRRRRDGDAVRFECLLTFLNWFGGSLKHGTSTKT